MKKALFLLMFLLGLAAAQSLTELLPAETFFALGTQDLESHRDKLEPYIEEFQRLELGKALLAAFPAGEEVTDEAAALPELDERLRNLDLLEVFGQEAWLAVSASSFNPMPALTALARLSPAASATVAQVIADTVAAGGFETLTEGDHSFYLQTVTEAGSPVQFIALAQVGDLLGLSSNPDALRGILRQLAGSADPDLASATGFQQTLGQLGAGNFYTYLDFSSLVDALGPLARGLGFDALVERLSRAFATAGVSASVGRISAEGVASEGRQAVNAAGGDEALYALLTSSAQADRGTLALAPADALSFSSSYSDLAAWWDYLNEISASTPELGGSLDTLLSSYLNLDLRSSLFSWTGSNVTTIATGLGEIAEPGVASSNLLGESVYVIQANDSAEAETGLKTLFDSLSMVVSSFADPSGGGGAANQLSEDIAGVTVNSYTITNGISLSYAVGNGNAYLATTKDALAKVLNAPAANLSGVEEAQNLLAQVPEGASRFTLSNNKASLAGTASQIGSQLQLMAGMGGAANLDFAAVEAASQKLELFLQFIAARLGYSLAYSERSGEEIASYSKSLIAW
jgi:hypothetical protein